MDKDKALVDLMAVYQKEMREFVEYHKNGKYKNLTQNPKYQEVKQLFDSINVLRKELNWPLLSLEKEVEYYANIIY